MEGRLGVAIVYILATLCLISADTPPRIVSTSYNDHGMPEFHGTIREDERTVLLSEKILVEDNDSGEAGIICGYVIHHKEEKHIPFVVDVTDSGTGEAVIRVRDGVSLDYEHREKYKFAISAFNCGANAQVSDKAMVHIHVEDVNEYAPVFDKYSYNLDLEEGHIYDNILTLTASDSDRSPEFHTICDYRVTMGNETFQINKKGVLSNKVELDHKTKASHLVGVVAVDCGHLESESSVLVTITVLPKCERGWTGIPDRIEYTPGSGYLKFASSADLKLCDRECDVKKVSVDVSLAASHIGKGCDRDTYSMHSQRKICGAKTESTELLPDPNAPNSWTNTLVSDDGNESDLMFEFNGKSHAVEVPRKYFNHHLEESFTISTWMRHDGRDFDFETDDEDENDIVKTLKKEHILCMTDSNKMNRHHYSWYLHGNKMVLLWRQEAEDAENKESFRPAEWRWNLDEINDNNWHHYAVSVNFPKIELYIDGEITTKEATQLDVVEDWPLHQTNKIKTTKLIVGACWQGGDQHLDMYFEGHLAGLYILNGQVETDRVINCLTNCQEHLDFESLAKQHSGMGHLAGLYILNGQVETDHVVNCLSNCQEHLDFESLAKQHSGMGHLAGLYILNGQVETDHVVNCLSNCQEHLDFESLAKQHSGMTVSFTRDQSKVSITGANVAEVRDVVRELDYNNARSVPTPGRRNVFIDTTITCGNPEFSSTPLPPPIVPEFSSYILVLQAQTPVITLSGGNNIGYKVSDLAAGQMLFKSVNIDIKLSGQDTESVATKVGGVSTLIVDKCTITADPGMNLEVERLTFPHQRMKLPDNLHVLDTVETNEGVVIVGPTSPKQYENVLQGITYYHEKADQLSERKFYVICSSQNGRFLSNKILFSVSAYHDVPNPSYHAHIQAAAHSENVNIVSKQEVSSIVEATTPSFGMIAIIVVCVGFLLFMIVLGIFRIRSYQRRTTVVHVDEKQEMEWDDSPLNIIVNPMEQELTECNELTQLKNTDISDSEEGDTTRSTSLTECNELTQLKNTDISDSEEDEDEYYEEDDSSFHDEDDVASSDEEELPTKEGKELAWDDSTLSF